MIIMLSSMYSIYSLRASSCSVYIWLLLLCCVFDHADVNLTVSDEERTINYTLGQSLILPCETGVPRPPDHATWRKDGDPIMPAENVAVLSDGTLLVLETSGMSEGTYQCTGYYSDEPLNSTIYTVSMGLTDKGTGVLLCTVRTNNCNYVYIESLEVDLYTCMVFQLSSPMEKKL